jgi:hypothetical protein
MGSRSVRPRGELLGMRVEVSERDMDDVNGGDEFVAKASPAMRHLPEFAAPRFL